MSTTKIALVTGGSRGLGKDMALSLAAAGTDIIFTYNSNTTEASNVVNQIRQAGQKAAAFQLNVADSKSFDGFISIVKDYLQKEYQTDRFDYLVNNAGTALYKPVTDTTEEELDNLYQIHYKSVYLLTQKALPVMNDGGRIINISSGLARFSFPGSSAYAAMKGAVEVLTRYQARELGSRQITANVVAPGAIATDFGGGRVRDNKEMNQTIASLTALGRVGMAEDIGGVVAFLCSDAARWINGQRIEVSGGMNL